ncbi:hypothetical protein SAMN05216357_11665 [Porphyromonadaceae bacterium KH3CP3RA]|nr:hypothetical protein SAMN05216357_11665 [Porphyromonadaceae bacterium KH3CP3RA]
MNTFNCTSVGSTNFSHIGPQSIIIKSLNYHYFPIDRDKLSRLDGIIPSHPFTFPPFHFSTFSLFHLFTFPPFISEKGASHGYPPGENRMKRNRHQLHSLTGRRKDGLPFSSPDPVFHLLLHVSGSVSQSHL